MSMPQCGSWGGRRAQVSEFECFQQLSNCCLACSRWSGSTAIAMSLAANRRQDLEAPSLILSSISLARGVHRSCFSYPASLRHARRKFVLWDSSHSGLEPHDELRMITVKISAFRRMDQLLQPWSSLPSQWCLWVRKKI